jgi:hypothetical protein
MLRIRERIWLRAQSHRTSAPLASLTTGRDQRLPQSRSRSAAGEQRFAGRPSGVDHTMAGKLDAEIIQFIELFRVIKHNRLIVTRLPAAINAPSMNKA